MTRLWLILLGLIITSRAQADISLTDKLNIKLSPQIGEIKEIRSTAIPGMFEITVGRQVFYTDSEGRYLIQGQIYDVDTGTNITQLRIAELSKIDFKALPFKQAIKTVRGNGKRQIAVFADPNCGYCKRFEETLKNVTNITVYSFVIPILGDDSKLKSKQLWCSSDRTQAWHDWMTDKKAPSGLGMCDNPVEKNIELARGLSIQATPTIYFEDGSNAAGALDKEALEKRLGQ